MRRVEGTHGCSVKQSGARARSLWAVNAWSPKKIQVSVAFSSVNYILEISGMAWCVPPFMIIYGEFRVNAGFTGVTYTDD